MTRKTLLLQNTRRRIVLKLIFKCPSLGPNWPVSPKGLNQVKKPGLGSDLTFGPKGPNQQKCSTEGQSG